MKQPESWTVVTALAVIPGTITTAAITGNGDGQIEGSEWLSLIWLLPLLVAFLIDMARTP